MSIAKQGRQSRDPLLTIDDGLSTLFDCGCNYGSEKIRVVSEHILSPVSRLTRCQKSLLDVVNQILKMFQLPLVIALISGQNKPLLQALIDCLSIKCDLHEPSTFPLAIALLG